MPCYLFHQLWDAGYPARIKHYYDMKVYSWKNTQFSQFNESDTLLLVSGVHFGNHSNTGEIAVFNLEVSSWCDKDERRLCNLSFLCF